MGETEYIFPEYPAGRLKQDKRCEIPVLILLAFVVLLPFLRRAFSIDDYLFIRMAQQILRHPFDPYGFSVNWSVTSQPMSVVMQNPPLNGYFIAGIIFFAGLSEAVLHAAFLLPAAAAVAGSYLVARRFCSRPFEATLAAVLTPAFLVCGSTVMCDMMLLAFWIWTIYFWISGLDENSVWKILASGLLIALSALTKYYGIALLPLLLVYSLMIKRKPGWWLLSFLIPVVSLIAYNDWTESLYGQGLLLDALKLSGQYRDAAGISLPSEGMTTLTFAGGCLAVIIFFAPLLWQRKTLAVFCSIGAALILLFGFTGYGGNHFFKPGGGERWLMATHRGVFVIGGMGILVLAVEDLITYKNAGSVLLVLWLTGTLAFAGFFNWTVNGRSLLIAAPALGIIMMRKVEKQQCSGQPPAVYSFIIPLAFSLFIALAVAQADYRFANSQREAAYRIARNFSTQGRTWFQGHWGFQYYMELLGARPLEYLETKFHKGDVAVVPENNTFVDKLPDNLKVNRLSLSVAGWLSTMNKFEGTAFHSGSWGPVPFKFGPASVPSETYYMIKADDSNLSSLSLLGSDTVRRNALIVVRP